jgi:hypothetical protein
LCSSGLLDSVAVAIESVPSLPSSACGVMR